MISLAAAEPVTTTPQRQGGLVPVHPDVGGPKLLDREDALRHRVLDQMRAEGTSLTEDGAYQRALEAVMGE